MPTTQSFQDKLAVTIATVGPVGHLPKMPGTWGSAAAVIAAPFVYLPFSPLTRALILAALLAVGTWAAHRAEKVLGAKDPGCIVVDEWVGQWLTFYPFSIMTTWQVLAGFVFFRILDMAKPWPIRFCDRRVPCGPGIMLDDVLAGIGAAAALAGARWLYVTHLARMM